MRVVVTDVAIHMYPDDDEDKVELRRLVSQTQPDAPVPRYIERVCIMLRELTLTARTDAEGE